MPGGRHIPGAIAGKERGAFGLSPVQGKRYPCQILHGSALLFPDGARRVCAGSVADNAFLPASEYDLINVSAAPMNAFSCSEAP
jgi:hypothetical protein